MMDNMEPITEPRSNTNDPDEVLAQTIAFHSDWMIDGQGHIYDERRVFVARSLTHAAAVMRKIGWFTPAGSLVSGVNWIELPEASERGRAVRHASPRP